MRLRNKILATVGAAVLATSGFTLTASAGNPGGPPQHVAPGTEWDSGWLPFGTQPDVTVTKACGWDDVVLIDKHDYVKIRTQVDEFGSAWLHLHGPDQIKIKDAKHHTSVTLDNSGDAAEFAPKPLYPTDKPSGFDSIGAKNLIWVENDQDRKVFKDAGLPNLTYLVKGEIDFLTVDGVESVQVRPGSKVLDGCKLLQHYAYDPDPIPVPHPGPPPVPVPYSKMAAAKS